MNDDSLTPEAELASAALDNEVTEVERAQVTASQSLSDELVFYTDLRTHLADVPVPGDARESALAAALAVFDELQAADSASGQQAAAALPSLAPVVSLGARRQRQYRWLGGAVAAAVVALLAVGVLGNLSGSSDKKSSTPEFSLSTSSEAKAAQPAPPAVLAAGQDRATDSAAASEQAPGSPAATAGNGELGAINGAATLSPWVSAPELDTTDAVIAFVTGDSFAADSSAATAAQVDSAAATTVAAAATAEASESTAAAAPGSAVTPSPGDCPQLSVGPFAPAIYQGVDVYVVLDEANREILIVDPNGCAVTTVALP